MSYYENAQWPAGGQWDHQTPPPVRSGASSTVPREEAAAFVSQIEEVDKAIDNLVKSGKMFAMPGRHGRVPSGHHHHHHHHGPRSHSGGEFGDPRMGGAGPHPGSNLSNYYANQRHHQPSRGSNEAEQVMQAKRRMAAQRERELRNYHTEQQYNRTVLSELNPGTYSKPDRTLSPSSMSDDDRRELIARQRSALYGEGQFADGGFVDETGVARPGFPGAAPHLRGHSPLAYEYGGRAPPSQKTDPSPAAGGIQAPPQPPPSAPLEGSQAAAFAASERSRANSNTSPQSNPGAPKSSAFDLPGGGQQAQQQGISRTSNSSPAGGGGSPATAKPPVSGPAVAPIGTRPSAAAAAAAAAASPTSAGSAPGSATNPALIGKRSTTPLPSPLSHGYTASGGAGDDGKQGVSAPVAAAVSQAPSAPGAEAATNVGITGWGGRPGVWGQKSGLGSVQASVWG